MAVHLLPNLKPVLRAQFWIFVPVFLLTEANLGLLGLGVLEPMPSLGGMLAELQNYERIPDAPWMLTPAILLLGVVTQSPSRDSRGKNVGVATRLIFSAALIAAGALARGRASLLSQDRS